VIDVDENSTNNITISDYLMKLIKERPDDEKNTVSDLIDDCCPMCGNRDDLFIEEVDYVRNEIKLKCPCQVEWYMYMSVGRHGNITLDRTGKVEYEYVR